MDFMYMLGSLPTQIGSLLKLKKLFINNNKLTGFIPDEILKLKIPEFNYAFNELIGKKMIIIIISKIYDSFLTCLFPFLLNK